MILRRVTEHVRTQNWFMDGGYPPGCTRVASPEGDRLDNVLDVLEVWLSLELTSGAGRNIVVTR
jgi:hypothetical protein